MDRKRLFGNTNEQIAIVVVCFLGQPEAIVWGYFLFSISGDNALGIWNNL